MMRRMTWRGLVLVAVMAAAVVISDFSRAGDNLLPEAVKNLGLVVGNRPLSEKEKAAIARGLASQVYSDPKGFFKIRPPAGWTLEEYKSDPRGKVNFNWNEGGKRAQLKVIAAANPFANFDALLQDCKNTMQRIEARYGATYKVEKTTLLSEKAAVIHTSLPNGFRQYQVQLLLAGNYYTFGYAAPDQQLYDKYLLLAQASIQTLEALPRKAKPEEARAHVLASKIRLGHLYIEMGKKDWALTAINEGLDIDPKNDQLLQLKKDIAAQSN